MDELDRFFELEEILPKKLAEQQKMEGSLEATKKQFKESTGCDTIEEAEKKLEDVKKDIEEKTKKRDTMISRFYRKYPFLKEEV